MSTRARWLLFQLADSGFPTGGFAHSAGLEAAVHMDHVKTAADLEDHLRWHLWNVGHAALPFAAASYDVAAARPHDEAADIATIDATLDAMLTSHVANRASRTQGRAFVATCARVFDEPRIAEVARRSRTVTAPSHLAPMFGWVFAALGIERHETLALYLYTSARGVLSAAVRLGVLGPYEAQRLQQRYLPTLEAVLSACALLTPGEAATVAPVIDIVAATHDSLYARLFQS